MSQVPLLKDTEQCVKPVDLRTLIVRRIHLARVEAAGNRPACDLADSVQVDEDGYIFLHFTCLRHGTAWRELIAKCSPAGGASGTTEEELNNVQEDVPQEAISP